MVANYCMNYELYDLRYLMMKVAVDVPGPKKSRPKKTTTYISESELHIETDSSSLAQIWRKKWVF